MSDINLPGVQELGIQQIPAPVSRSDKIFIYMNCMYSVKNMNKVIGMNPSDVEIYGSVKVGERGQIVIPSKARKEYDIKSGDLLIVIGAPMMDGVALIKAEVVKEIIEKMSKGLAGPDEKKRSATASKSRK
jgi:AbrB family looped-hinge helix DNA binding protein